MAKMSILCVDDEVGILKSLERCLTSGPYEVLKALSAEEGLLILEARRGLVDLIIIDQRMAGMSGEEFLRHVREKHGTVPAIMLSGYADFGGFVRAVDEGGVCRFMAKPWDNQELLDLVSAAIDDKGPAGQEVGKVLF